MVQTILEACEADLQACVDRDPACEKFSQCMLYFKGFQAIQCHRLNHWLWKNNRKVSLNMTELLLICVPPYLSPALSCFSGASCCVRMLNKRAAAVVCSCCWLLNNVWPLCVSLVL